MDKLDQILQAVTDNQKVNQGNFDDIRKHLSNIEIRLVDFDVRFKGLDTRISRLEDSVVGINTRLMAVEDNIAKIPHIEQVVDQTFGKIDGFMVILNRFESEIAATRMKYELLEERVTTLESRPKT